MKNLKSLKTPISVNNCHNSKNNKFVTQLVTCEKVNLNAFY